MSSASGSGLGDVFGSGHHHHAEALQGDGYGTDLARTFMKFNNFPIGEVALRSAGWTKHNSQCDPNHGFVWTEDASGATKDQPTKLYTTAGGQAAGVGVVILSYYGADALPAEQQRWATEKPLVGLSSYNDKPVAHIDVAFRSGAIMCDGSTNADMLGDTLIVNPGGSSSKTIPLMESQADTEGYRRGSCIDTMGWHWFLDTSMENGRLSWQAANVFPIVPMYHEGVINAIFFASTINQVSIPFLSYHEWEPMALNDAQMCTNTCDSDCTFAGNPSGSSWSTMHIFFNHPHSVACDQSLHCGATFPVRGNCCDAAVSTITV